MLKFVLGVALGSLSIIHVYNSYFNPLDMLSAANGLARNAYRYGCVTEHGKNCEEKSAEYYNKLNSIKRLK